MNIAYPHREKNFDIDFDSVELFLINYLKYKKLDFKEFKIYDIEEFDYSNIDFILFSFYNPEDLIDLIKLNDMKMSGEIKSQIIIGGSQFDFVKDLKTLEEIIPAVDYFVIGKGEEALFNILKNKPNNKIHYDLDYETDYDFYYDEILTIDTKNYNKVGIINLSHNICSWNKCRFCGVVERYRKGFYLPINRIIPKIRRAYENGVKTFYFYDNSISYNQLRVLLTKLSDLKEIRFLFFGVKADKKFVELKDVIENFDVNPIFRILIGLEFYDQEILDLYSKGIDLEDINKTLDFFHSLGTEVGFSILFSLPLVKHKHVEFFKNWMKSNSDRIYEFGISVLKLKSGIDVYENSEEFGVKLLDNYTFYDYIDDSLIYNQDVENRLKKLESLEVDFIYKNSEHNEYLSRDEVYDLYYKDDLEAYGYLDDDFIRKK